MQILSLYAVLECSDPPRNQPKPSSGPSPAQKRPWELLAEPGEGLEELWESSASPNGPQNRDGELLFHLPGAELRSGSFPHSGLGWGCHKSITNDEKHTMVLVTMGKVPNWGLPSMARVASDASSIHTQAPSSDRFGLP